MSLVAGGKSYASDLEYSTDAEFLIEVGLLIDLALQTLAIDCASSRNLKVFF